jgi:hypothetical protein
VPQAAHAVLRRGSQESARGSSRRAAHSPNARGRADQSATGAGRALLVVWTEPEPEPVACKPRKDVKMDVVKAFTVREEGMDAAASGYAVPYRARVGTRPSGDRRPRLRRGLTRLAACRAQGPATTRWNRSRSSRMANGRDVPPASGRKPCAEQPHVRAEYRPTHTVVPREHVPGRLPIQCRLPGAVREDDAPDERFRHGVCIVLVDVPDVIATMRRVRRQPRGALIARNYGAPSFWRRALPCSALASSVSSTAASVGTAPAPRRRAQTLVNSAPKKRISAE